MKKKEKIICIISIKILNKKEKPNIAKKEKKNAMTVDFFFF